MPEPAAIDQAVLRGLLETTGGDTSFLAEVIDTYVEDAHEQLTAMRQALVGSNAEAVRRAAHSLKSNSASLGALTLSELCKALEEQGKTGTLDGAAEWVTRVEAEYDRVQRALQAARPPR